MPNEKQKSALKALGNAKVLKHYTDGSLDISFEGSTLAMSPGGEVMTVGKYMQWVNEQGSKMPSDSKKKIKAKSTTSYVPFTSQSETPCERTPGLCDPREISHIAWDADDTIWEIKPYAIAGNITGDLELIDPDTVVETKKRKKYTYSAPTYSLQDYHDYSKPAGKKNKYYADLTPFDQESVIQDIEYMAEEGLSAEDILDTLFVAYEVKNDYWKELDNIISAAQMKAAEITGLKPSAVEEKIEKLKSKTGAEVDKIMEELTTDLSQKDKDFLGIAGEVTGKQLSIFEPKPEKKSAPEKEPEYEEVKTTIKLMPGFRDTLEKLREKGITNSIISLNNPGSVKRIIKEFGLADDFIQVDDTWGNKGTVFKKQVKDLGINPKKAIFVDNTQGHVEDVSKAGVIPLVYGKDIKEVAQVLNYIKNS
jgi:beta-phosphoglucomutase-like phosphatase (HAD superfamily)